MEIPFRDIFFTRIMKTTVKTGLIAAASWILLKLSFFYLGLFPETIAPAVLLNILGLLLAISIGLFVQKRKDTEETSAMHDIKNALSAGFPYVLLVCIFIYLYYAKINPSYYANQVAKKEIAIEKMVNDPKALEVFKASQPDAEVMTNEAIEAKLKDSNRKGASPGFTATLSVLSMLLLATIYSILVTIIYRKILFKRIKA